MYLYSRKKNSTHTRSSHSIFGRVSRVCVQLLHLVVVILFHILFFTRFIWKWMWGLCVSWMGVDGLCALSLLPTSSTPFSSQMIHQIPKVVGSTFSGDVCVCVVTRDPERELFEWSPRGRSGGFFFSLNKNCISVWPSSLESADSFPRLFRQILCDAVRSVKGELSKNCDDEFFINQTICFLLPRSTSSWEIPYSNVPILLKKKSIPVTIFGSWMTLPRSIAV